MIFISKLNHLKSILKCSINLFKYVITFLIILIITYFFQDNMGFNDDIGFSLVLLLSTSTFFLLLKKEGKEPIKFLKIHKVKFNIIIILFIMSIMGIFFDSGVLELLEKFIEPDTSNSTELCWKSIIHLVILAPICEEVFFRGIIFSKLKNVMPVFLAIVIQGIIFGGLHGSLTVHLVQILAGILYGVLYHYTNNLTITILLHSFHNLLLVIVNLLLFDLNINLSVYISVSVIYLLVVIRFINYTKFKNICTTELER